MAGTHTPQSIERALRMGPRLRGDDSKLYAVAPASAVSKSVCRFASDCALFEIGTQSGRLTGSHSA